MAEKGWTGQLKLVFKNYHNKTVLAEQYYKLPMQVLPPHYQDNDGTAFVYLLNPSGGILQGDRIHVSIRLEKNSRVLAATPSSNKLYKMETAGALIENEFFLSSGSVLEYLPGHTVPYKGSNTVQSNIFHIREDSSLFAVDTVTCGRKARNEIFQYKRFCSTSKIVVDGHLALYDCMDIKPLEQNIRSNAVMGRYDIVSSIYIYGKGMAAKIREQIQQECMETDAAVKLGITAVNKDLAVLRIMAANVLGLNDKVTKVWEIWRKVVFNKPKVRIRKY